MWAATQHPTRELIGKLTTANFTLRCAGWLPTSKRLRSQRGAWGSGAERLPGRGAFLWIAGATVQRFTAYRLPLSPEQDNAVGLVGWRGTRARSWLGQLPATATSVAATPTAPAQPTPPARDNIDQVADQIAPLWRAGASKNAMAKHALGKPYGGGYAYKIDQAIARLAAQAATTTDGSAPSTGGTGPDKRGGGGGRGCSRSRGYTPLVFARRGLHPPCTHERQRRRAVGLLDVGEQSMRYTITIVFVFIVVAGWWLESRFGPMAALAIVGSVVGAVFGDRWPVGGPRSSARHPGSRHPLSWRHRGTERAAWAWTASAPAWNAPTMRRACG